MADQTRAVVLLPDARERLARHLYLADSGDDQWTRHYWDSGQTSAGTRQRYQQRADAALKAITGTEN